MQPEENVYDLMIEYFTRLCDAPDFHIKFMPFSVISSRVMGLHQLHYGLVRLNFMILVVGEAYLSQKSSLIGLAKPFSKQGFINTGSVQSLWQEMEKENDSTILHVIDEYSGTLQTMMKKDSWLNEYAPAIASIFTGGHHIHKIRGNVDKKKGVLTEVRNVNYNFLGGIQPPILEQVLDRGLVAVGFFPRHLMLCVKDDEYKDSDVCRRTPEQVQWERDMRRRIHNNLPRISSRPLICDYTDEALAAYNKHRKAAKALIRQDPQSNINRFRARYIDYYIKTGDMLAIMDGSRQYHECTRTGNVFMVDTEYINKGAEMINEALDRIAYFCDVKVERNDWYAVQSKLVKYVRANKNQWIPYDKIYRVGYKSGARAFLIRQIIDGLVESKIIDVKRTRTAGRFNTYFRWTGKEPIDILDAE
jgi:hypothetical protein